MLPAMDVSALEQTLFSDIEGYALSSSGRSRLGHASDPAFTYGEVTPSSVSRMLGQVQVQPGEVFYDLGSGTGKAVLFAAILGGVAKATGVELVEDLYLAAERVRERYEAGVRDTLPHRAEVAFRRGDMLEQDLSDADIVFTHSTCFDDTLMLRLAEKLSGLRTGARVITVTKSLPSPDFELIGHELHPLAWGEATLYYHRRR